jgi:hypothetical protein
VCVRGERGSMVGISGESKAGVDYVAGGMWRRVWSRDFSRFPGCWVGGCAPTGFARRDGGRRTGGGDGFLVIDFGGFHGVGGLDGAGDWGGH